jgi:uncharacterized coiled-coil protein SlyX
MTSEQEARFRELEIRVGQLEKVLQELMSRLGKAEQDYLHLFRASGSQFG